MKKVTVLPAIPPVRKLKAVTGIGGGLWVPGPKSGTRVYVGSSGVSTSSGESGTLEGLLQDPSRVGIYEGDRIEIQF
jgi:hypothetical protein